VKLVVVSHACVTPVNQDLYARVQARTGWDVAILLPRRWRNEYGRRRAERWSAFHGELVALPVALAGSIPLHVYVAALRRRLSALAPDVVYVHNEPYAAGAFQVVRAARGLRASPAIGFYSAQNLDKRYRWPVSRWERWVYEHADFALPVSAEVADVLTRKGYRGRIKVLPLAVDTERYRPQPQDGGTPRNGRPLMAGYVGRLAREKGVDTLLEALPLLDTRKVHALIVGDGPARDTLMAQARSLGIDERVTWSGYIPHEAMADVYRAMDVLVVPSRTVPAWKEQFGRVVVEALACGVPVIASDSGELPKLLTRTGGGWIFPEGQAAPLARLLVHVAENTAEMHDRAVGARRAVERQFGLDAVADRFSDVVGSFAPSR
jgi:glycosyltransferase involved in cell wall biosynthesis